MARLVPSLAAVLLCSTALAGCSTLESLNPFGPSDPVADKIALEKQVRDNQVRDNGAPKEFTGMVPGDLNGGVRMAHELRLEGKYDEASRILSQLMLVASDDPRVVAEYGKTLLQRGRLDDAAQFLTRATQLQSGDWTTWSALGVTYDQMGNQASAKFAYDRAVALAPNEASVLSNYALSRLLANDVTGARALAARAANAGGAVDPKIARNIAMIEATSPQSALQASAAPVSQIVVSALPVTAPVTPVQVAPVAPPAPPKPVAAAPQPISTPTAQIVAETPKPVANPAPVKVAETPKPVATPVKPVTVVQPATPVATAAPRILVPQTASNTPVGAQQYGAVVQAIPVDPEPIKLKPPVATVASAAPSNSVAAAKPAPAPVKPAATPVKTASAVAIAVKPEAVAPVAARPVEQPKPAPVKTSALSHDGVPALRLASDATTP